MLYIATRAPTTIPITTTITVQTPIVRKGHKKVQLQQPTSRT